MPTNNKKNEEVPAHTDAYYEEIASQEEIYLEEREEEVRAILIFDDSPSANVPAESLDQQLEHAAEELIAGDSDDPPLSEEVVVDMIETTVNPQRRNVS